MNRNDFLLNYLCQLYEKLGVEKEIVTFLENQDFKEECYNDLKNDNLGFHRNEKEIENDE